MAKITAIIHYVEGAPSRVSNGRASGAKTWGNQGSPSGDVSTRTLTPAENAASQGSDADGQEIFLKVDPLQPLSNFRFPEGQRLFSIKLMSIPSG